jgi:PAS domain S-box-containing protein
MKRAGIKLNTIKIRLIAAMLLLALLPTVTIGWISRGLVFENIRAERIKAVGQVAEAKHNQLAMLLNRASIRARLFLSDMGTRCSVAGKLERNCATRLVESYLIAEGATGAALHMNGGRLDIGASAPAQHEAFQPGQLAGFFGMGPGRNQSYFVPVAAAGLRLEVVYPSTNLQPMFDRPHELGKSGETFLADGQGYFVTRNRYPATQGHSEHIHAPPMQSCLRGENNEVLDLDYRDAEIIHGYRFISEFGSACIMAHADQAEAFAPLVELQNRLGIMSGIFGGAVLLIAFVMANNIALPIGSLSRAARRIASGDYRTRVEGSGNDEISELAESFNSMAGQLEQKIQELGKSEERYRKLFEEAADAVAIADAETGELLDLNQSFADLFGWERKELIGKPQRILHPPEPNAPLSSSFRQHKSESAGHVIETVAITKEGRLIDVAIRATPMSLNGRMVMLGAFRDITARNRMERKLADSYRRLQQMSLHMDNVREEERGRIALELHDEMGATLTALKMSVHWLASRREAGMAQFAEELERMNRLVADATHTMRHVVGQLMPAQLREHGFAAAVERYVHDFRRNTGIECSLVLPDEDAALDDEQSAAIFRILQEALNNVAKHARATRVRVVFVRRNHSLLLLIGDDGIGFDTRARKGEGFGLLGIRERALMIGGRSRIDSAPGRGTRVAVRIAVPA